MKVFKRAVHWIAPKESGVRARVLAWLSLATELTIVGTGGAVRLTASGLGCPSWPLCSPDSLVPVPEQGIHSVIEFSNRLMTGVVGIVALLTFFYFLRQRSTQRSAYWLSFSLLMLVLVQAGIGGITVLSSLESWVVGLHFLLSALMVVLATCLVWEVSAAPSDRAPALIRWIAGLVAVFATVTVLIGILTTGSGPHAGDSAAARNGLSTELLEHLHAWPGYLTLGATCLLSFLAWRARSRRVLRVSFWLLVVEAVQIGVGLYQARNGLPPVLVGIHLVFACLVLSLITVAILSTRSREKLNARQLLESR